MPMDVCKTVMKHIVLHFPIEDTSSQNINRSTHDFIDPTVAIIRAMIPLMHNIHPYARHTKTKEYTKSKFNPLTEV